MKLFTRMKDGGDESRVWGYWLIESKRLLSIALLHFLDGSREAYHSHAFNSVSWLLRGKLTEYRRVNDKLTSIRVFRPSLKPIITTRDNFHKVVSKGHTWVVSFRGPWVKTWKEFIPSEGKTITLTHGRSEVKE